MRRVWGDPTTTYDWCEANYAITPYVAEFFNTLSSIPVLMVGVFFFIKNVRYRYGKRFALAALGVAVVGAGSIAFHGTLQRWGQILDEVPMLWSSLVCLWIGCCNWMGKDAEKRYGRSMALGLFAAGAISTANGTHADAAP